MCKARFLVLKWEIVQKINGWYFFLSTDKDF